jgi:hypothetical protein
MIRAESKASRQKTRRRWVVTFWCLMMMFFCVSLLSVFRHGPVAMLAVQLVLYAYTMSVVLGGVGAGGFVKSFRGKQTLFVLAAPGRSQASFSLDERETRLRDRAHYTAYAAARWLALALFSTFAALLVFNPVWANRVAPSFFFLLTWTVWSLPQSIILWTEPDMDPSEPVVTVGPVLSRRAWIEAGLMILFLAGLLALLICAAYKI